MKKLILAITLGLFTIAGTATQAEARPHRGNHGYHQNSHQPFISHYRHGRPVYKQRYVAGYKRCGTPIFRYRHVSAPRRHYRSNRCDSGYSQSRRRHSRNYYNSRNYRRGGLTIRF